MLSAFLNFRSNMARICCTFVLLMIIPFGYGFNCPDESGTFYYSEVSVDCMVYHLCKNSEVTTFMCPFGLAFDHKSEKCKDASVVQCTHSAEETTFEFASTTEKAASNEMENNALMKYLKERLSKEGFLFIGKYFSTKGNGSSKAELKDEILKKNPVKPLDKHRHSKSKRSVESNQSAMQDAMFQYRLANNLILPLVSEIMQDSNSKNDVKSIFLAARSSYLPLSYKATRQAQSKDVNFQVSRADIEKAKNDFLKACGPKVRRIVDRHLFQILRRLSGKVPLVLEMIDRLEISSMYQVDTLKANVNRFVKRYSEVIRRSYNSDVSAPTREAVKRDFWYIETILVQFFSRFLSESPGSLMKIIYNRNSVVYRMIMGESYLF